MNVSSALTGEDRANAAVGEIGDPIKRRGIGLIVDEVVQFYRADTTRLVSPFDLEFFVDALTYDIHNLSMLLRAIVDVPSYLERTCTPAIPANPLDPWFLVMAVDHALRSGSPARAIVEQVS